MISSNGALPERPNILLIMTDQHRLSAVGAYGDTPCQTPHIDALAEDGIRFENAYTTCPVCTPARASVITGQYPHNHGMITNIEEVGASMRELGDRPTLLSRCLERAGYQLGYTGKWHLGSSEPELFGHANQPCLARDVGFSGQSISGHGNGGWHTAEFGTYLKERGLTHGVKPWSEATRRIRPEARSAGELEQSIEGTVPYFLADHTIAMIDRFASDPDRPFFMWHNFWGPHEPYYATTEYIDLYRDVDIPSWPNYEWDARGRPGPHQLAITPVLSGGGRLDWDDWAMYIRYYYALTSLIDAQIGRIIDHLKATGLLDNTVIIFAADHGESLGDHGGLYNKGWTHFEETQRIPLIIRMPDGTGTGKVSEQLTSLVDLYPTVLELACPGSAASQQRRRLSWRWPYRDTESVDGRSLLPLVRGEATEWRDSVVVEFHGMMHTPYTMRTLRHGCFKYGYSFASTEELYDLDQDPYEMVNLIDSSDHSTIVRDMRTRLQSWMQEMLDPGLYGYRYTVLREHAGIE